MTTAHRASDPGLRVPGVVAAVGSTAVLAAAGTLLAVLASGRPQVLGVLVGAALVAAFFLFGTLSTGLAAAYAPRASLLVALMTYTLQVVVLGLVLAQLQRSGTLGSTLDGAWLGATVVAGAFVWMGALLLAAYRIPPGEEVRR